MKKTISLFLLVFLLFGCSSKTINERPEDIDDEIYDVFKYMTLEEKVAQLLLVRCPEQNQEKIMKDLQFGGYILYEKDFLDDDYEYMNKDDIMEKIESYRKVSKIAPFIAVDEEGGDVARISRNNELFEEVESLSPQVILKEKGIDELYNITLNKNIKLKNLGINLNLSPVADVTTSDDAFMARRSMGVDHSETSEVISKMIRGMNEAEIGSCLKHFPGYGDSSDTHGGLKALDERNIEDFNEKHFLPFKSGIDSEAGSIMVSHIFTPSLDEKFPASLSENVHKILRNDLGFEGVIITDDVWMISKKEFEIEENLAPLAIKAGNDMIISTGFAKDYNDILEAVKKGEITEERINESVIRILKWKQKLKIM